MTDAELSALEAATKSATPGPWKAVCQCVADSDRYVLANCNTNFSKGQVVSNAAHIAAANPAAILSLIAELRQLQIERDWLAEKCEIMAHALDPCEFYPSYYWKDQAKTYAKEAVCQK